jgi:uncharacterized membrane protein
MPRIEKWEWSFIKVLLLVVLLIAGFCAFIWYIHRTSFSPLRIPAPGLCVVTSQDPATIRVHRFAG